MFFFSYFKMPVSFKISLYILISVKEQYVLMHDSFITSVWCIISFIPPLCPCATVKSLHPEQPDYTVLSVRVQLVSLIFALHEVFPC